MNDYDNVKIDVIFGCVELHSFFRMEGLRLIGVGVAIHKDQHGKITKVDICDSGASMEMFPEPDRKKWWQLA